MAEKVNSDMLKVIGQVCHVQSTKCYKVINVTKFLMLQNNNFENVLTLKSTKCLIAIHVTFFLTLHFTLFISMIIEFDRILDIKW